MAQMRSFMNTHTHTHTHTYMWSLKNVDLEKCPYWAAVQQSTPFWFVSLNGSLI